MERVKKWFSPLMGVLKGFWRMSALAVVSFREFCRSYVSKELSASSNEASSYWAIYGGWRAVIRSPALLVSIVITAVCFPYWKNGTWPEATLSIVPNLLGFSLGAMAVILAFPSAAAFKIFAERGREDSYYMDMASKFAHFIFVQVLAIMFALIGKAYCFWIFYFLAFWF
jgi:hypothetical protein